MSIRRELWHVVSSVAVGSLETTINSKIVDEGYTFQRVVFDGTNYTLFFSKMNQSPVGG